MAQSAKTASDETKLRDAAQERVKCSAALAGIQFTGCFGQFTDLVQVKVSVLQPQLLHSVDLLLFIFTVLRGWFSHSPLTPQQAGLRLQKLIFFCHVKNLIPVIFSYSFSLLSFQAICACVLCQREQKGLNWNEIGENYARLRRNLGSMHRDKNMEPTGRESLREWSTICFAGHAKLWRWMKLQWKFSVGPFFFWGDSWTWYFHFSSKSNLNSND